MPAALLAAIFALGVPLAAQAVTTWNRGDVFAAVGSGQYKVYDNAGTFKETISQGVGGFTTGCSFNNSLSHLYTTNFSSNTIFRFQDPSPHAIDLILPTPGLTPPTDNNNESIAFMANGNFLVGHATGGNDIHQYTEAGVLVAEYDVASELVGSDWIDLAANQTTVFYTSEGKRVLRFDIGTNTQLPDFATGLPGTNAFALRILPPGDGSGGVLVADRQTIVRLDATGTVVQSYDVAGEDNWFALNLDPNGTSFWSGDFGTGNFYRFNIASGAIEVGPIASLGQLFGLCLKGEPTAGGGGERPPLDHFKCYAATAAADHPAAGQVVRLDDQFGESTATIEKVYNMCNPTAKNEERINQKDAHLVEYKLINRRSATGKFLKHRVTVDNQFGTMTLLVQRPNRLMVPSSKTLLGEQPGDPPKQLDHFLCYKIHASGPFTNRTVSLEDQFGLERADIRKPRMLCNPVSKNGEAIQSGDEHLVCYIARGLGRPVGRSVVTRNQFGVTDIRTNQVRHLCVPSKKRELEN